MNKLNIIFEDESLIIIDKPAGLTVNNSQTSADNTLQDMVGKYLGLGVGQLGVGDRAGIVHRLDRETSGLMVVAKSEVAFGKLQKQFRDRETEKEYVALAHGMVNSNRVFIDKPIGRIGSFGKFGIVEGGRESKTIVELSSYFQMERELFSTLSEDETKNRKRYLEASATYYSLLNLFPKTGRTHQIRVHLKSVGHPIVSDTIYCPSKLIKFDLGWCDRLFLHAKALSFTHPKSGKKMFFESQLPSDLLNALDKLKKITKV